MQWQPNLSDKSEAKLPLNDSLSMAHTSILENPRRRRILPAWLSVENLLWCALIVRFVNVFGPFAIKMPLAGLDFSWRYGLDQAVAQHLAFGSDIIFTFGPYASVYTRVYHPATVHLMIYGVLLLDALCLICFIWLAKTAHPQWPLILAWILVIPLISHDTFLYSLPLLLGLVLLKVQCNSNGDAFAKSSTSIFLAFAFACLGLLPLIKGTLLVAVLANCAACSLFLLCNGHRTAAVNCFLAPATSLVLFWLAAGQKLTGIPQYFASMRLIISGYSEAMATPGSSFLLLLFIGASVAVLAFIALRRGLPLGGKTFLFVLYALYLFLAFKSGFVRQGFNHVVEAAGCLVTGVILLPLLRTGHRSSLPRRGLLACSLLAISFAGFALRRADTAPLGAVNPRLTGSLGRSFQWMPWNIRVSSWPTQFERAREAINETSRLNFKMSGTTDIYFDQQSSLLAAGYRWDPRPVLQSYSAFTPELILLDEQHLRSARAPDNLIFRLETIDDRLPSLDDGLSWPAIMDNYTVDKLSNGWVHLGKKAGPIRAASRYLPLGTISARLGEEVPVPSVSAPVFAEVAIAPNTAGRLVSILYTLPVLGLRVTMQDGRKRTYRVNSSMMETGFLLSPLVTTNEEFANLFNSRSSPSDAEKPRSIALVVNGRDGEFYWHKSYTIAFKEYLDPRRRLNSRSGNAASP